MSKTNYHAINGKKNTSYDDLSSIISTAIESEPFLNKTTLVPKIRAIIAGFKLNVSTTKYNRIENPSDAARRLRAIEKLEVESKFWRQKMKVLLGEKIEGYYYELDELLKEKGFK